MRAANLLASVAMVTAISSMTTACDDGSKIDNEIMQLMYPESFRPGNPEYLERDLEAGADFICMRSKYIMGATSALSQRLSGEGKLQFAELEMFA